MTRRTQAITYAVVVLAVLTASACALAPQQPTHPPAPSALPAAPLPSATPTATPSPLPTSTPLPPTLAIPAFAADAWAASLAAVQQAQPALRLERVPDSATALAHLQNGQVTWAVIAGLHPYSSARLLCLTPYVPIVHFASPLDRISSERLKEAYQGAGWNGAVLYSGDVETQKRVLDVQTPGIQATRLPSWQAVIERVASDRTALAFVPWSAVDARVKTLALDGRSIADGVRQYGHGDTWWLLGAGQGKPGMDSALSAGLTCPTSEPMTFMATGDILMGWYVHEAYLKTRGPLYPFERVRDTLRSADITFADFENSTPAGGVSNYTAFAFGAAPDSVLGLRDAGIDVVNIANNHMGDYGLDAVADTIDNLRRYGIGYVGAGKTRSEARSPWITSTKGITVAILGYNEIPPDAYAATETRPGTAWLEVDNVLKEVKQAKALGNFVIVALHMGNEYTAHPNARQQEIARSVAEAGADLIIGDHPHVVQALGFFGKTFVTYSLGDFVYVQPGSPATGEAAILRAVIDGGSLKQIDLVPVYIDRAQPYAMSAVDAKLMIQRIFDASRRIGELPGLAEQPVPARATPAMSIGAAANLSGMLVAVAADGNRADVVTVNPSPKLTASLPTLQAGNSAIVARLTSDGLLNDAPAVSPDGRRIAYSSARNGNIEIYVAGADGSGATNASNNPAWDDYPTWSPDGKQIAFSSNRDGAFHIFVMNADGGNVRQLTVGGAWDTTPSWSPDGKRIAFASDRGWRFQIYTISVDGSDLRVVSTHPHSSYFPSWSPDSRYLVYQTYRDQSVFQDDDANQDRDYELFISDAQGNLVRQLTNNRSQDVRPAWSPDGKRIVFASDRSQPGDYQLYVMDAGGDGTTQVTTGPDTFLAPRWAP